MTLLFATQNHNKVKEIKAALKGAFEIQSLLDLNYTRELDEPYDTFVENAKAKAKQGFDIFGLPCFSEDAGLVVEVLEGRPGVLSARYAGPHKNGDDNLQKVLDEMKGYSLRSAYFIAVIAYYDGAAFKLFEGRVYGNIAQHSTGTHGFGYDPIFIPLGYDKSFGELPDELKLKISHRSKATKQFVAYLETLV